MKVKVYVAGKWEDREACKRVMTQLRARGYEITRDWTVRRVEDDDKTVAIQDTDAVRRARVVVIVAEKPLSYRGAYSELGMSLARNKSVILIGNGFDECIFSSHPSVKRFSSTNDFFDWLDIHEFMNTYQEWHAFVEGVCEVLCPWRARYEPNQELKDDLQSEHHYYAFGRAVGVIVWIAIAKIIQVAFF